MSAQQMKSIASRRCAGCGSKGVAVTLTFVPCGCAVDKCARCGACALHSIDGPLIHKIVNNEAVLEHACGHRAPLEAWRVERSSVV
jgi:hypothetical protein